MASSTASSSLARHVQALYPLARVLAGDNEAAALVEDVYDHAANMPPDERPSDERSWLFRLLIDRRHGSLSSTDAEIPSGTETSFTDDPFRREVAEQTAKRKLPVAFAACSLHERVILALDVLASPSDTALATALDTTEANARTTRDQARSALRASLRDVLNGPERMLVDVALPDKALRAHLRTLLEDRFQPTPSSLRATVRDILERARAKREADAADSANASTGSLLSTISNWHSVRPLVWTLALVGVFAVGIAGWMYLSASPPSPSSPQSIVDLSVQRASEVTPAQPVTSADEAETYIRATWGRRVSVPSIKNASLRSVSRLQPGRNVTVPVLLYDDPPETTRIAVYAFSYALLDRLGSRGTLDRALRTKLATNQSLLDETHDDQSVVLWRQKDDIFVAVAPHLAPSSLRGRIQL
ncbi:hypothetical protein BSZ35_03385 [Salinibacter sp. 10B]|uniref:hypothetical protein n=1 Tax=Salinibacter sp. 10B TaxID=1923971 RepID=UPI000CF56909|nr:hypothetical protein [Salinibacter sp. 10B]PQJ33773.1 hypothetical protein BSZ35_03385 [Salinibacter sp. 10B]